MADGGYTWASSGTADSGPGPSNEGAPAVPGVAWDESPQHEQQGTEAGRPSQRRQPILNRQETRASLKSWASDSAVIAAAEKASEATPPRVALVDTPLFILAMGLVVLANVIFLGVEIDTPGSPEAFKRVNEGFLLIYLLELVLRFLTYGTKALQDKLTLLDIFIVILAFIDRIASQEGLARALPVFRVSRVFRLLRVLRFLRNSRELNILLTGFYKLLVTLMWVVLLLGAILWAAAACTKVVIGESAAWNGSMDPRVEHEPFSSFDPQEYFGSVPKSILTLLQVLTLSQWADHIARQVLRAYPALFVFWAFFLLGTTYSLLMTVVSVMVQDAIVAAGRVQEAMAELDREERRIAAEQVNKIFAMVDVNGDGDLSVDEIREALEVTDLEDILIDLGVPVLDPGSLVSLFDRDGDGCVNQEELVNGIIKMNDDIQPSDFVRLEIWVWSLRMRTQALQAKLERLYEEVSKLKFKLEVGFIALRHFANTVEDTSLRHRAVKAIRNAPPDLPLAPTKGQRPLPEPQRDADGSSERESSFARLLMPRSPAQAAARLSRSRRAPKRWVTIASPFVAIRDEPHLAANHIAALKPGDLVEFEDLADGPVKPEHLTRFPYLKCWKLDGQGARAVCGFVVGYTPHHGPHFALSGGEAPASRFLAGAADSLPLEEAGGGEPADEAGVPMTTAVVTAATPPRRPSPESGERSVKPVISRGVLPPAPPPLHVAKMEAKLQQESQKDKYGMRGTRQSPSLLQLQELLA